MWERPEPDDVDCMTCPTTSTHATTCLECLTLTMRPRLPWQYPLTLSTVPAEPYPREGEAWRSLLIILSTLYLVLSWHHICISLSCPSTGTESTRAISVMHTRQLEVCLAGCYRACARDYVLPPHIYIPTSIMLPAPHDLHTLIVCSGFGAQHDLHHDLMYIHSTCPLSLYSPVLPHWLGNLLLPHSDSH